MAAARSGWLLCRAQMLRRVQPIAGRRGDSCRNDHKQTQSQQRSHQHRRHKQHMGEMTGKPAGRICGRSGEFQGQSSLSVQMHTKRRFGGLSQGFAVFTPDHQRVRGVTRQSTLA